MSEGGGERGFTLMWHHSEVYKSLQFYRVWWKKVLGMSTVGISQWGSHSGNLKYSGDLNSGNIWIVNFYIIVIRYKVFDEQHQRAGQNIQPTKKSEKLIK